MLFPNPENTSIFIYIIIYINIAIIFHFRITYFLTAALQRCNSEGRAELARAMPSACSLDEVNAATARAEPSLLGLCRAPVVSTKSTLQHMTAKNVAKIWLFEILLLILPRNYEEKKEL